MRTRKYLIYLIFLLFLPSSGRPQVFDEQKPLAELESSMEANLTWNLQNALLVYYPENKFVVKASVKLKRVTPKRKLPKLPDALLSKSLERLPGLPYIPDTIADAPPEDAGRTNLRNYPGKNSVEIAGIRVNVLVDESLQQSDWSFIRRYATLIADLEPTRGDQVRIERLLFPDKSDFFAAKSDVQTAVPYEEKAPQQAASTLLTPDWLPYAFASGVVLLLIIAFFLGIRAITKSMRGSKTASALPAATDRAEHTPADESRLSAVAETSEKDREEQAFLKLKSEMIDTLVGTPASAAAVFNQWIEQREDAGLTDAATLLGAVSKPLVDLLAPYLGLETTAAINGKMAELDSSAPDERIEELMTKFNQDLRLLLVKHSKEPPDNDALAFLNQLSDNQLEHLLKPLKVGIKAIVLAQMRSNRSAKFLSKMDIKEKKDVLMAMGNIKHIPLDVYQHIARQLAARAHKLDKMRYVRADGVEAVAKVMEYLDEQTQEEVLQHLQTQDVKLAEKINEKFMTFNQLLEMHDDEIQKVALEVDREVLAKSLVTVDENTVEKIVRALPEKLRELVVASLEANHDLPENEVAQARRTLMRTLREKHKQLS